MRKRKGKVFQKLALTLSAAFLLTGCNAVKTGSPDDYATNKGYEQSEGDTAQKGEGGISKDQIKVGVLYLSDPDEGSGYSYTHDLGVKGMQENLLLSDDQIERKIVDDTDEDGTKKAIEECVSDGCNIIFTTSWGYMQVTADMAEKYPDVYFSHGTGYMSNGKNFNNYFGRIYQARYLSGIVAGMNTKNNKIGYVDVTNSWYDEKKEKKASERLLSMGCDVMTQHCDTSYPQTLAQEKGVYGIGYNSDMSKETPKSCLTSVIWNWSAYYTAAVKSVIDGTWDGSNYYGGMAEGLVEITGLASFAADGTQQKVDEATAEILSGQNNVFDGVLETNTGKKIGQKGKTLDDATITGKINWYYRNVVVIK